MRPPEQPFPKEKPQDARETPSGAQTSWKVPGPKAGPFQAFLGDGSYLMLHTEIVSAVQEGLKLIIVVNDNHGFGCIHGLQRGSGGKSFGNEFRQRTSEQARLEGKPVDVDFAKNAESLGATGLRAMHAPIASTFPAVPRLSAMA